MTYPEGRAQRDKWIVEKRTERDLLSSQQLDARRPYGFFLEDEMGADGRLAKTAVILLTNRECPWRCLMCDLWKNTLVESVPPGAIAEQVCFAMDRLGPAEVAKLYNSGSFFDPRAIPPEDYPAIARRLRDVKHVIVESHPALVGDRTVLFRDLLDGTLEVAMGLETAQPEVLEKLNKGMTLDQFAAAADRLREGGMAMRAFILVRPPFVAEDEAEYWAKRSIDFAFDCGASAVSLIPVRSGNGAMEALQATGDFEPPLATTVEAAMEYGLTQTHGRVFTDLWDWKSVRGCAHCRRLRMERLARMNRDQKIGAVIECGECARVS